MIDQQIEFVFVSQFSYIKHIVPSSYRYNRPLHISNKMDNEENSTTVQNVSNASVLGLFSQVVEGAINLVELLPSMSNAVKEVKEAEKHVQSALVGITATSDPGVVIELADLQKEFRAFIRVGKDFLENCLSMAKYATDKQHVTEIKEQLESKTLDKLKVYISIH